MASTFVIQCPECEKQIKVSEEVVGKKIRCKECEHVFLVKKPKGAATAAPEKSKPKVVEKPKSPLLDDDEDGKNPYKLIVEDEGIARCPSCAKELESKDAIYCLHCGYNTMTRTKAEFRAVYEPTGEDKFKWLLPAYICIASMLVIIGLSIFIALKTRSWMIGGWFYDDESPDKPWIIKPGAFILLNVAIAATACFHLGKFAYRRLFIYNQPPEKEIEREKDPT